ncbi:MAG: hypothetical protein IJV00_00060 [Clostridia bacterium]|nr:hypothetical protein [Clostridia bacterium]
MGLSFYEVNGMTYMYYYENGPIYTFDGDSFADTGKTVKHSYVLSVKADDGFGYFGGVFDSGGRIEPVDISLSPDLNYHGLFRVDLLTGKEERYVETADYVTSVAVNGTKVYYVTCTEFDSNYYYIDMSKYPDARFSLKCVDTVTGEILNMIPDSDQAIKVLGYQDGRLYFFRSAALDPKTLELCFIDSDDLLFALPVTYPNDTLCYPVVFSDSWIFIRSIRSYSVTEDGGEDQVRFDMIEAVDVYDLDGNKIGDTSADFCHVRKSSIKNYLVTDDSSKRFERWGGDDLAIYGGKIVSYSAEGFYLDDPKSRSSQKIIDRTEVLSEKENAKYSDPSIEIADYLRYCFFRGTSKTVYNGKLYILIEVPLELINVSLNNPYSQAFEEYFNFCPRIVEYDGADVRLFDINPANASR